jgi:DNA-binding IclR family transcriptional regulator
MHAEIARRILDNGIYIQRMLGGRGLAGMALIEAHFAGDPWLTAQQIAERTGLSDDTVRRRMADLVRAGRAIEKEEAGRKVYAIKDSVARQVIERTARHTTVPS